MSKADRDGSWLQDCLGAVRSDLSRRPEGRGPVTVGQPARRAHGANARSDKEHTMGTDRPDDRVPRRDPNHHIVDRLASNDPVVDRVALSPSIPTLEWVFMSNTVLGGVAPGCRSVSLNGVTRSYAPWANVHHGARWCAPAWLDRRLGSRGFLARRQGMFSKMGLCVAGACWKAPWWWCRTNSSTAPRRWRRACSPATGTPSLGWPS